MVEELVVLLALISGTQYTNGEEDAIKKFCPLDIQNLGKGWAKPERYFKQVMLIVPDGLLRKALPFTCRMLNSSYWEWQIRISAAGYPTPSIISMDQNGSTTPINQGHVTYQVDTCMAGMLPIPIYLVENEFIDDERGPPWPDCRLHLRCTLFPGVNNRVIISATPKEDIAETHYVWNKNESTPVQSNWSLKTTATACATLQRLRVKHENATHRRTLTYTHRRFEWKTSYKVKFNWGDYTRFMSLSLIFIITFFAIMRLYYRRVGGGTTASQLNNQPNRDTQPAYNDLLTWGSRHRSHLHPSSGHIADPHVVPLSLLMMQGGEQRLGGDRENLLSGDTERTEEDAVSLPGNDTTILPTYEQASEIEAQHKVQDTKF